MWDNKTLNHIVNSEFRSFKIGIGLKPSFCGQGHGAKIMTLLIEECKRRFSENIIALEVRSFNKRAINCYNNVGFEIKEKYKKDFNGIIRWILLYWIYRLRYKP